MTRLFTSALLLFWLSVSAAETRSEKHAIDVITLNNGAIKFSVSPDIGGRVLHASLTGEDNLLMVNHDAVEKGKPKILANGRNIGYMGHIVWHGPQSAWWAHQTINPERKKSNAPWPPDPYTVLASNKVKMRSDLKLELLAPPSPVTGLEVKKTFDLSHADKNQITLDVQATNSREQETLNWDIWFNTRVGSDASVYVPVKNEQSVRVQNTFFPDRHDTLNYQLEKGLLTLSPQDKNNGRGESGKLYIQPAAGWIAAFRANQLLIIEFKQLAQAAVHPEQAQVEIYLQYDKGKLASGFTELEVHSAYTELKPGESMQAQEVWRILPYKGSSSSSAQIDFLLQQLNTSNQL